MSNYDEIFSEKVGSEFESSFAHEVKVYLTKQGRASSIEIHLGDKLDTDCGTDCIIDGVPVDFTTAFSTKDNLDKNAYFDSISTKYGDIKFAIRLGNTHKGFTKFAMPVLVVGMDLENSFANTWREAMMEHFAKIMNSITDAIFNNYCDYCDMAGIDF